MANTLRAYNPIFYAQEGLITLENQLQLANEVHRGYDKRSSQKGDTIRIKGPATFSAQAMPITADQDADTRQVDITVDQWHGVRFGIQDDDLDKTQEEFIDDHIRPATVGVAEKIDATLTGLFDRVPNRVNATDPAAVSDLTDLRERLFELKVPNSPRWLMVDGGYENDLLQLAVFHQANTAGSDGAAAQREGFLGRKFGFDIFSQQSVPSYTAGSTNANATAAAASAGDSSIQLDDGSGTATGTISEGDILQIDGETQDYVVTADASLSGGVFTASIFPDLENDVADNTSVTVVQDGGVLNMGAHRNAFALAMANLPDIGDGKGAQIASIQDPKTQLSLRSRMWYDGDNASVSVGIDALWGVKVLDPDLACRLVQ